MQRIMLFIINLNLKSSTMMKRYISVLFALLLTINMFGTDPSVTLTTYYANIDGQSNTSDALRIALCTIISNGYTSTSYSNLKNDMYAASSNPTDFNNGSSKTLEDIYSSKAYTVSEDGSSATSCGTGWNKEHTIPQSWFNEATPMKSDAHHVFPTDIKMNSVRSNYPYGENNASLSCSSYGYGHLGTSTFSGYTGTVFDPGAGGENGSYKGDLARAYFYMVTRYRTTNFTNGTGNVCFTYTNNVADLTTYMKNLMLKWHREDPVSEKERIRNNAIYAHQHNRNPFIDYPELVEYIWGNKVGQTVALSSLTSGYVDGGNTPTTYNVTLNRNGSISVLSGLSDTYTLPTASTEADACDGWAFAGWSTSSSVNTTTAPSFTTSVSSATTLYAVYSHTESSSAPIRRVPATVGTTMWAETWTGATTATSGSDNATPSANYGKGTTVYNSGTITYTQSANTVYVRNENTGGGTAPELLLSSGKTWTISNIPTGEATELTLTYKSNNTKSSVTCSTTGASITGSSKSYTITTSGASTITLVFGCSGNTRIDDVSLTVKTAGSGGSSGGSTTTYMTTPTCGDPHTITLSGNGSTNGGEFSASNESAYAGATISLFATPEEGYQFGSWTVTKAGGGMLNVTNNQFTMPDADVTISASFTALPTYNIKFYNNGRQIGSTQSVYKGGKPNVPSNPESCEGYTFVGWWTSALAANNTTAQTWITDFTVTQEQNYYAIFSHTETSGSGGNASSASYTFTSKSWAATEGNWTSGTDGAGYNNSGVQVTTGASGANATCPSSYSNITSIVVSYCTNTSSGAGSIKMSVGSTELTQSVTKTGGTTARDLTFDFSSTKPSGEPKITVNCTTNSIYVCGVTINYGGGGSTTTHYTSSPDCSTPQNVTVSFNANGGTGTMANQTITYNTATALTANTFTRTGYTFQGWATSANGEKVYNDQQSVTLTSDVSLYAVWKANSHNVTFTPSPAGATVTINGKNSSPQSVDYNSTVTIAVTPTAHYSLSAITVSGASGNITLNGSDNSRTFTMPDEDVTVAVTMTEDAQYTVNWYVAGTPTTETNYAGEALVGTDASETECNGKVFVGWTATADYSSETTAPSDLFTDASTKTMPSNNSTNYYAVFAEVTNASVTATFDPATASGLTESPTKTWTHDATGVAMQLYGSSSRYTNGNPNTWTMSHSSGSKTVITSPTNITQIVVRSVYQYTSSNKTYNGWINDASVGTLSPTTFTSAESDGYVTQTISNINAKSVTIQDNSSSSGNQARVIMLTVTCGSTTYANYTTSCTAPTEVTVTFNANYEGADPATATQTIPYNTATALTANTFTRTGYTFQGWATSANGNKVYDNSASVTLTENTTLYALWTVNSYTITTNAGTGGSLSTSPSGNANFGETVTITVTPDGTHTVGSVSVKDASNNDVSVSGTGNERTFTMPASNVTVSATFNQKQQYSINFIVDGETISTQNLYEGATAQKPTDPTACEGYTFVGWWTSTLAANNTTTQTWITDFTVSGAQDYYAVFCHTETSGSGGSASWSQVESLNDITDGTYIIENAGYALPSATTSAAPVKNNDYVLTISNKQITSAVTDGMKWSFTMSSGHVATIKNAEGSYLYTISNNNGLRVGNTSDTWTFAANSSAPDFSMKSSSQSRYCATYSSGSDWRSYTTATASNYADGGKIHLYKYSSGGSSSTTYYTSSPDCVTPCTTLATPAVTATPSNGQITLTWADVEGADHYSVTISKGAGYTTECGNAANIGTITGTTTKTCVITGLTNGLTYTTSVIAHASSENCDSEADEDTAIPTECEDWTDPTLTWSAYNLNTTGTNTATCSISGTTHGTRSFESSNTEVLTVASDGTVTAVGAGTATVTVSWTAADGYCEKSIITDAFEVAGPLSISFDANGGEGTMSDQTVTYKVSTAIKENAFTRTGYTFQGWALTAAGSKEYNDKQSVAFTNSLTLYAVWQLNSHEVTFTSSVTGATVTVNGQSSSPQTAEYGSTVTLFITPTEHYIVSALTVSGTSGSVDISGTGNTRTFTMPDEAVTVTLTMVAESQYTATFYNGTATFATVNGYVDDDIAAPTGTPTSCDDETFTFVGWVATAQTTEVTTSPQILTFPQVMINGGVSYYALFRRSEGGSGGEASVTFKTASQDGSTEYSTDSDIKTNIVDNYTGIASFEGSKAYPGKSGVKLGSSKNAGSITLNLSSPITTDKITVEAVKYGTDAGDLKIEVNGSTAFGSAMSPAGGTLEFTDDEMEISSLTVLTTSARAYVASISLGGGGTSYYTTAPECAACENQVTITKGTAEHGTFQLSKADGSYDNCKSNVSVTVSGITPDEGYYCTGVTATGSHMHVAVSGPDGSGNYTVAYAKGYSVTSTITANFAVIPTHTVTWSANGSTTTATYSEGAAITFPTTATGCDGMTFMGWSAVEVEEQENAPAYTTEATMGTEDITFYAVFATASSGGGGEEGWSETAITDLTSSDIFVIVGNNGSNYAMTNDNGTGSAPAATGVTVSDGKITSTVADNLKWKISGNATDGYVFYPNGSTNTWLYCTATNNGVRVGTNNSKTFTIDGGYLKHSGTSRYVGVYNSSDWRCYTSNTGQSNIAEQSFKFYKYSAGRGSTTYSGYTTSCTPCEKQVNIVKGSEVNGSYALSLTGAQDNCHSAGVVVTVTDITATGDYQFKEITQEGIATGVTIDNDAKTVTYAKDITGTSTINVVFEPKPTYTIRFYNNGALVGSAQTVTEGHSAVKPSNPTACSDDYTFVGWWTRELALDNTAAYTWVTNFTATKDQDYYAVYEYTEGGSSEQIYSKSPSGSGDLVANGEGTKYTLTIATGVTVTISGWSNNVPVYHSDGQWRIYGGSNVVIASTLGNISKIQFSSTQNNLSTSQGSYSSQVWTGDASSVTFTNSATQSRITGISVTVGGGGITYYTTAPDCEAPIVTSAKMLVAEYGGARVALMHDNTNTVAALPLMCFGGNYFIPNKDKNGNTVTKVPDLATLTWQVMERTDGYYIKSGEQFLAQTEGEFEMDNESFLWPKQGALRLAYDADIESFVVAAGEQGDLLPGITPVDVPGSISLTELNSPRDLTIGRFGTICLPHAVALPFTWGVKVYSIEGAKMTDDKLVGIYMVEETEMLTAGKPYLIEALTEKMNMWYATGAPTADKAVEAKGLVGNLGAEFYIDPTQSDYYYVLSNNQLRRVGENAKVKVGQYKAYFDLEGLSEPATMPQAYAFKVMYVENNEQVETDLNEVPATINWDEPVYNILGMRVDRNATGVLIQGGTKFIIRVP